MRGLGPRNDCRPDPKTLVRYESQNERHYKFLGNDIDHALDAKGVPMSDQEDELYRARINRAINDLARNISETDATPDGGIIDGVGFGTMEPPPMTFAERKALGIRAYPPSQLPETVAGRLELIHEWMSPQPIYDQDTGEPTGEYSEPLITKEQAAKLMEGF